MARRTGLAVGVGRGVSQLTRMLWLGFAISDLDEGPNLGCYRSPSERDKGVSGEKDVGTGFVRF